MIDNSERTSREAVTVGEVCVCGGISMGVNRIDPLVNCLQAFSTSFH